MFFKLINFLEVFYLWQEELNMGTFLTDLVRTFCFVANLLKKALSISQSQSIIHLSVCLVSLSMHPSILPSIHPSIIPSICVSIYLSNFIAFACLRRGGIIFLGALQPQTSVSSHLSILSHRASTMAYI